MGLESVIHDGGKVLVVGGTMNPAWKSFENDPRVSFWCGSTSEIQRHLKNGNNMPPNTKAVLISRFIGHSQASVVVAEARKKRALIVGSLNDGELTAKLEEILGTTRKPAPVLPASVVSPVLPANVVSTSELRNWQRGEQITFIAKHHKGEGTITEEARRLLALAATEKISSTHASFAAAVGIYRRKLGFETRKSPTKPVIETPTIVDAPVVSAVTQPSTKPTAKPVVDEVDALLRMIDDSMATLGMVREKVVEFRAASDELAAFKKKLREMANS
jgi:hypothetical protein